MKKLIYLLAFLVSIPAVMAAGPWDSIGRVISPLFSWLGTPIGAKVAFTIITICLYWIGVSVITAKSQKHGGAKITIAVVLGIMSGVFAPSWLIQTIFGEYAWISAFLMLVALPIGVIAWANKMKSQIGERPRDFVLAIMFLMLGGALGMLAQYKPGFIGRNEGFETALLLMTTAMFILFAIYLIKGITVKRSGGSAPTGSTNAFTNKQPSTVATPDTSASEDDLKALADRTMKERETTEGEQKEAQEEEIETKKLDQLLKQIIVVLDQAIANPASLTQERKEQFMNALNLAQNEMKRLQQFTQSVVILEQKQKQLEQKEVQNLDHMKAKIKEETSKAIEQARIAQESSNTQDYEKWSGMIKDLRQERDKLNEEYEANVAEIRQIQVEDSEIENLKRVEEKMLAALEKAREDLTTSSDLSAVRGEFVEVDKLVEQHLNLVQKLEATLQQLHQLDLQEGRTLNEVGQRIQKITNK